MRELGRYGSGHSMTPGAMAALVQPLTVEHTLAGRITAVGMEGPIGVRYGCAFGPSSPSLGSVLCVCLAGR